MENNKYLEKIYDYIMDRTIINYEENTIFFPAVGKYIPISYNSGEYTMADYFIGFSPGLKRYGRDTFGLTDEEAEFLWVRYKKEIMDTITKEYERKNLLR